MQMRLRNYYTQVGWKYIFKSSSPSLYKILDVEASYQIQSSPTFSNNLK